VRIGVAVFVGVENVAAMLRNKSRNAGDHAFAVRTAEKEDGRFPGHVCELSNFEIG
jgi:hypothetical protein